ncbi:ABC transporter permease [Stutzerimonas stutzeri]|uniref:ABC transporter permease n=1 Tax=Stutzerimonas stutzeri TaxID=316 RepID=UPI00210D67A3|nr:ABC transporter permease [Stutzerimonas stutzeri]MCQ4320975.1 ABC transporter permease [Stutzerimonas stutzeri]
MIGFIFRRLRAAIPTLILVSLFVFTLQKLLPGDPVLAMAGEERDPQVLEYLRDKYRLNDPIAMQYLQWIGDVLKGDFGRSMRTEQPVTQLLLSKLPVTLQLAAWSVMFAMLIGIPAGIIAAVRKGTWVDYGVNVLALSGISIPNFWLGLLLILLFAVKLQWLPASGFVPFSEDPLRNLQTMLMPAFVLGASLAGTLMRHTRSAMLEVLRSDYVRTARAKGLMPRVVILKHALRNALMPIVTLSTLLFGELLGGAVLTEQVFSLPGFGKMIVDAVFNRDYAVVQGVVLCVGIGFILLNLLADVLYRLINPRMRTSA